MEEKAIQYIDEHFLYFKMGPSLRKLSEESLIKLNQEKIQIIAEQISQEGFYIGSGKVGLFHDRFNFYILGESQGASIIEMPHHKKDLFPNKDDSLKNKYHSIDLVSSSEESLEKLASRFGLPFDKSKVFKQETSNMFFANH